MQAWDLVLPSSLGTTLQAGTFLLELLGLTAAAMLLISNHSGKEHVFKLIRFQIPPWMEKS